MVNVRRAEVAARIHEAKEHGDVTENAEYEDAKNEQAFVEGRIQTLSALIKNAVLIDENHSTTHVQIGSTVEVQSEDGKEKFRSSARPRRTRRTARSPTSRRSAGRCSAARRATRWWSASRPGTGPTRSSASAERSPLSPAGAWHPPTAAGRRSTGPTSSPRRRRGAAGRQRLQDAVGHGPRRQPARRRAA
jgi:hypothetical protein